SMFPNVQELANLFPHLPSKFIAIENFCYTFEPKLRLCPYFPLSLFVTMTCLD
ncbi:MAG: hypothetical protein ACI9YL_001821, partial [Luteibaculaceae bacterium]